MTNFCTLFDSNYLTRGIALNESLARVCPSYHLYVVAFDSNCYKYLQKANLPNLTPISMHDFEDQQLLAVKPTRSIAEYCWTCTPSTILYCIERYQLPSCTYLDADMIFYHDPQLLFDEMNDASVLITPHRYTKDYDNSATHGIYCVEFMFFRHDEHGMLALRWWRDRCLEWCYAYLEDGKFGDQKYLDDWPTGFKGVHVLQHPGGGMAPWNVQQYALSEDGDQVSIMDLKNKQSYPLVFYHFHGLKFYSDKMVSCTGSLYEINKDVKAILYFPYIRRLLQIEKTLIREGIGFNPSGAKQPAPSNWTTYLLFAKDLALFIWKGRISPFNLTKYDFSLHDHFYKTEAFN
jgi:hypothetical protein